MRAHFPKKTSEIPLPTKFVRYRIAEKPSLNSNQLDTYLTTITFSEIILVGIFIFILDIRVIHITKSLMNNQIWAGKKAQLMALVL